MKDIKYKSKECKDRHGIWGIISIDWYGLYYRAERYDLGRLQYEKIPFEYNDCTIKGVTVHRDDTVVNIHIPSSGPLRLDDVEESLKRAYDFFDCKNNGKMIFVCKSWLLFPDYKDNFSPTSNIYKFREIFTIFSTVKQENLATVFPRIFYKDINSDISSLPNETSLQRAFLEYMNKENAKFGFGCGMIIMENGKRL